MNLYLACAAALSLGTALLHSFLGGREIARPLLDATDIHDVAKYTSYYCWHLVTIALFVMAGSFAWAAIHKSAIALAVCWTLVAVAYSIWSFVLVAWKKQSFLHMPQWALFASISIAAILGLV